MVDLRKLAQSAAAELRGTCGSIDKVLDQPEYEPYRFNEIFLEFLDDEVMCCEQCEWWLETGAIDTETMLCDECTYCNDEAGR